ncbi:MAG: CoA transferase [Deltaproteobacteria bacterium]|nr:CoA transferase [Deltaproteobacteria bacterium]
MTSAAATHPALEWAASGAMAVSGRPDGPPVLAPAALATWARERLDELRALAGARWVFGEVDGGALLGERAAIFGYARRGAVSPSGTCRLLRAADGGFIAANLPRDDDWRLVPAWLEDDGLAELAGRDREGAWAALTERVGLADAGATIARARLLGLAVAPVAGPAAAPPPPVRVRARGPWRCPTADGAAPLVVDLSSLWAGPLSGHLLAGAGARVVKVESTRRPDGARRGPRAFLDLLNAGKESVALDFTDDADRAVLVRLVERADLVIESSRPRALRQLGIDAERIVARAPGKVWLSLTGYGRGEPEAEWVAFGDDASAAAGLVRATGYAAGSATPLFCGDAIADPLAGIEAAVAGLRAWRGGESVLLDVSLCDVVRTVLDAAPMPGGAAVAARRGGGFDVEADGERMPVAEPRARTPRGSAADLGADTTQVLASLGIRC